MSIKILIADDSKTIHKIMEMTFAGQPVELRCVFDAEQAIEEASAWLPTIVFADASMEGLDGYEVSRALSSEEHTAHIPVVIMASQHVPYDEETGTMCQVKDHILKPFETQALLDIVPGLSEDPMLRTSIEPKRSTFTGPESSSETSTKHSSIPSAKGPIQSSFELPTGMRDRTETQQHNFSLDESSPNISIPRRKTLRSSIPPVIDRRISSRPPASVSKPPLNIEQEINNKSQQHIQSAVSHMGLSIEQQRHVVELSKQVIEQVVWEVVPDLAESIIRQELERLLKES